ncbi:MFS transporter [Herbiconiux sp. CPCC 203407]|uniref:MFS transporter n=1 Tax=Herbiconiux oxytropis TaxID=2970915 RepID=A0AA41XIW5_9MICO|nr:MDR family MFS transporter [Herbiconiux oxytropis]MCS5722494.1 MFS transporter [Herbiconiux oxytropis]MCS5727573.1 MFS transporter [Herbiconiux oxytropis]
MSLKTSDAPVQTADAASRRRVLVPLSGLLLGMFVAMLASTVVSSSLPKIIGDLGGTQAGFTWVVTSTLLATTVSTPIWGKLADLTNRKLLIQLSLLIFIVGSGLAGLAQSTEMLIFFRVLQGLGAGGLTALVQVVMADIIPPRERGRYMGLLGAVMAVATVGGPLLGGVITDSIGWRWNFYIAEPFAIAAIIVLQRTLHIPTHKRKVRIDYLGAALIAAGVSLLLIWVTLAGNDFEWLSATSVLMVVGAVVLLGLAVLTELKVKEPIIPMALFTNRTFWLAVVASISVGVAMFGTSVFLSQYMQLARGKTPTESGIYTIPMIAGVLVSSIIIGQVISRTGRWKRYMVTGSVLLTIGLALMGTIRYDTDFALVFVYMFVMGAGVGMVMQNLVLIVQNAVDPRQIGTASASVAFFRSLGGTIGVSVMGAVLGSRITTLVADGLAKMGVDPSQTGGLSSGAIPDLSTLPEPVRILVESAYGEAVADVFLIAVPLAVISIIAIALLPNRALGTKTSVEQIADQEKAASIMVAVSGAEVAADTEGIPLEDIEAEAGAASVANEEAETADRSR